MERRTLIRLAAAGVVPASPGLVNIGNAQDEYKPEFFNHKEFALADVLSEIILPADEHSPGASAAKVARYLDVVAADSLPPNQRRWRSGLKAVDRAAKKRFKVAFVACSPEQREQIVADMAAGEAAPKNELEQFFVLIKRATLDGYYTSRIGIHEEFGYEGNVARVEFPGCDHETHA